MRNILIITVLFTILGCNSTNNKKEIVEFQEIKSTLMNKRFHLNEINGEKIPYHYNTNIHFKNNTIEDYNFLTSKTPCNRVFGNYKINGDKLIITGFEATKNICIEHYKMKPDAIMKNMYKQELTVKLIENGFILKSGNNSLKFNKYYK
jgi:heat shock protein HslJ